MRGRSARALVAGVIAAALAGCGGSGNQANTSGVGAPPTTGAGPTTVATTVAPTTTAVTTVPTTVAPTTTVAPVPATAIPTVPTTPDQANPYLIRPEDEPILAAYLEGLDAFHAAAAQPWSPSEEERLRRTSTLEHFERVWSYLVSQAEAGRRLDTSRGMTARPFIVDAAENPDEAYIYDCQLDGTVWVDLDGQPLPGETTEVRQLGALNRMVRINGQWLLAEAGEDSAACTGYSS